MRTTYEQDQQFISELLRDERNKVIEECALELERIMGLEVEVFEYPRAIRALKSNTGG